MDLREKLRAALADVDGLFDTGDVLAAVCPIVEPALAAERGRCARACDEVAEECQQMLLIEQKRGAERCCRAIRALPPTASKQSLPAPA